MMTMRMSHDFTVYLALHVRKKYYIVKFGRVTVVVRDNTRSLQIAKHQYPSLKGKYELYVPRCRNSMHWDSDVSREGGEIEGYNPPKYL